MKEHKKHESTVTPRIFDNSFEEVLDRKIEELKLEIQGQIENSKQDLYKMSFGIACLFFGVAGIVASFVLVFGSVVSYWLAAMLMGVTLLFTGLYFIKVKKEALFEKNKKIKDKLHAMRGKFHH